MSGNLNTLLLAVGGLAVVVILLNALRPYLRKKRQQDVQVFVAEEEETVSPVIREPEVEQPKPVARKADPSDLLIISIHAKPGKTFGDYMFLQTLGSVGLEFGDQHIFHYDIKTDMGSVRLFSVAKLNKPGTFDIDNVDSLTCSGLLLFVNRHECKRLELAIDCLLDVAHQLADELDGVLYEGYNILWTEETDRRLASTVERT